VGSPQRPPDITRTIRELAVRVDRLSRPGPDRTTPVLINNFVSVTSTAMGVIAATVHNATGATIIWHVLVSPSNGATISLQLRDIEGNLSPVVTSSAVELVTVRMPVPAGWAAGELRLVYLDAAVDTQSCGVLPVAAIVA
jgi:hypothetical protein